ncbi:hypothetical protein [Longimicrobium sp.]|uniref:hypothetical protein n=1 Tax=Longimicrobium sp. TaxID=2029185 RepID=UPI002ED98063
MRAPTPARRHPSVHDARPTLHRGVLLRSALEARWARCLDLAGVPWAYEPRRVVLPGGGWYLPDFQLPGARAWLEVKGPHFQRMAKVAGLARLEGRQGLVLVGTAPGVAWRMLPAGKPQDAEIAWGKCRCREVAVGPATRRTRRGRPALELSCRACGGGCWAQGVLGW